MDQTLQYIQLAHEGDKEARDTLVHMNMGLVWSIVRRFTNRGYDPEDLFQVGSIGLLKAIDHFDLSYDVKFSTYAVPLITGEIRRFLRDDGMVKVSRSLKENAWKASQSAELLCRELGREATLEEISVHCGIPVEDIVLAMSANAEVDYLYRPVAGLEGRKVLLQDQICDERDEMEQKLNHILLEELLQKLDAEERRLIYLRYFQGKTQTEVAKILGTTQVQVSRVEKKLLKKMRHMTQ